MGRVKGEGSIGRRSGLAPRPSSRSEHLRGSDMTQPTHSSRATEANFNRILSDLAAEAERRRAPVFDLFQEATTHYEQAVEAISAPEQNLLLVYDSTEIVVQKSLRAILWSCAGRANDVHRTLLAR